jgi:hypothetical protein
MDWTIPWLRDFHLTRQQYQSAFGRTPSLLFPKTFNEKVRRAKLFNRDRRLPLRVDKIAVKQFVEQKLGQEWVTQTLWYGDALPPLPERNWSLPYVLKASHGSRMNLFIRTEADIDWPHAERLCTKWLNETWGDWGGEWVYSKIRPRLLVEPFFGTSGALPVDYKLWTFSSHVKFIQVDTDREHAHKRTMFDLDWNRLPFTTDYEKDPRDIPQPASLRQMIAAAKILSEGMPFVRIDLYDIDGKPRFGEMTFYPDSGTAPFMPAEFDRKVGDLWR